MNRVGKILEELGESRKEGLDMARERHVGTKKYTLLFPEEMWEMLLQIKERQGYSPNDFIRTLVRRYGPDYLAGRATVEEVLGKNVTVDLPEPMLSRLEIAGRGLGLSPRALLGLIVAEHLGAYERRAKDLAGGKLEINSHDGSEHQESGP